MKEAACHISGAQALDQSDEDAIAGSRALVVGVSGLHKDWQIRVACCARDMRSYPFWARY